MIWALFRFLILPLALGLVIGLTCVVIYVGMEYLLTGCTDFDRGLWEGIIVAFVASEGDKPVRLLLRRMDAARKELL